MGKEGEKKKKETKQGQGSGEGEKRSQQYTVKRGRHAQQIGRGDNGRR